MRSALHLFLCVAVGGSVGCTSALGRRERPRLVTDDAGAPVDAAHFAPDAASPPSDAYVASPEQEDAARTEADAAAPPHEAPDAASPPPVPLGDLRCRDWPEQHTATDPSWGARLTDVVRHLPRSYGDTYYDADTVTYGHETTHGIDSHVRNYLNDTGDRANGLYVLDGRACLVREPDMRKSDVAPYVPASLRWSRFDLYVAGSSDWDDTPLYLFDEWVAYTNGSDVGIDRFRSGLWTSGWRGVVDGTIELSVYAIAVGMAAEVHEPGYFAREPNFRAFLAWNLRRALRLFREGRTMRDFAWDDQDAYFERLRTGADASEMRAFIRRVLGDDVADEILAPL